ncbi:MarR family winged helix-turn-helix transcriptional regulator [Glaciimonas sp. GNP009]
MNQHEQQAHDDEAARTLMLAGEIRVLMGKLKRRLREEVYPGDFTASQMSVLSRLEREGPATVTALALAEGVRPQSIGATVAVLTAAGMVSGAPDPADGRQTILSLTTACREWVSAARSAREDWLFRSINTKLSAEEQATLAVSIKLLSRLVDA